MKQSSVEAGLARDCSFVAGYRVESMGDFKNGPSLLSRKVRVSSLLLLGLAGSWQPKLVTWMNHKGWFGLASSKLSVGVTRS
jgi:hypothetical protein